MITSGFIIEKLSFYSHSLLKIWYSSQSLDEHLTTIFRGICLGWWKAIQMCNKQPTLNKTWGNGHSSQHPEATLVSPHWVTWHDEWHQLNMVTRLSWTMVVRCLAKLEKRNPVFNRHGVQFFLLRRLPLLIPAHALHGGVSYFAFVHPSVCLSVCVFVYKISQKVFNQSTLFLVEAFPVTQERKD